MYRWLISTTALLFFVATAYSATPTFQDAKWRMLIGDWIGEGAGEPGVGGGAASFQFDLAQQVLIRRNHSEYPAADGRPAIAHDDLMVIYPGSNEHLARAIYFDNESHVIEYSVAWSSDGNTVTFLSQPTPTSPQFRLIYKKIDAQSLGIVFEMAPPGHAGKFKSYLSGRMKRSK